MRVVMDNNAALARLTAIFQDVFDRNDISLNMKTTASDVDGWDSLAHIRLMIAIEGAFSIKFDVGEFQEYRNVGDLVAGILQRHGGT
jgi:acyl carrier protein